MTKNFSIGKINEILFWKTFSQRMFVTSHRKKAKYELQVPYRRKNDSDSNAVRQKADITKQFFFFFQICVSSVACLK